MSRKFLLRQLALLIFFALVGFLALYNVLLHSRSHIPGSVITDYFHFHWSFWWVEHALTTRGVSLYETDYIMFPYQHNLAYHTLAVSWFPVYTILKPLVGTLVTMALIHWIALTLTGYFSFLWLRRESIPISIGLLGSVALEVSPLMLRAVVWTHPNLICAFWLPISLLVWGQIVRAAAKGWQAAAWALVMGLVLWGITLTDLHYVLFTPFLLVPYALLTLIEAPTWKRRGRLMLWGGAALLIALLLVWVAGPLPYLLKDTPEDVAQTQISNLTAIPFPMGYLWSGGFHARFTYVGGAVTLPALAALLISRRIRQPRRWFWLGVALLPLILSLGAALRLGSRQIDLPFRLLYDLTNGSLRTPDRFAFVFPLPLLVFVGLTFAPYWNKVPSKLAKCSVTALLLLLVMINLQTLRPLPIQPAPYPYKFYEMMGREKAEYVIIEAPTAAGSGTTGVGEVRDMAYQYYGAFHHKRMINGILSRVPTHYFWYLRTNDPLLSWLGQRRHLEPDLVEPELARIIPAYPVGYIVLHQDSVGRGRGANEEIIGYFNGLGELLCPPLIEGEAVVYRTTWHPKGCTTTRLPPQDETGDYVLDIGTSGDEVFLGAGWHYPEIVSGITWRWAGSAPQTLLYVDLPAGSYTITLRAQAFDQPRQFTLRLFGVPLSAAPITVQPDSLQELRFDAPTELIFSGQGLILALEYDAVVSPAEAYGSTDPRPLAVAVDWVKFHPKGD